MIGVGRLRHNVVMTFHSASFSIFYGIMMDFLAAVWLIALTISIQPGIIQAKDVTEKNAVVTLVTGTLSGYTSGAIALGQSLIDVGSKLRRVVMVTPNVDRKSRDSMKRIWEVVEVQEISCNHRSNLDPTQYDLQSIQYQAGIKRWSATCTKFAAFTLIQFERVIFMDSDTLVVAPIDDAIYGFSNASFLAAPDTFPPDNFNSGFLVLNPSNDGFANIMRLNKEVGSAEGGDQGVFNNGLCPNWHAAQSADANCGRLPFIFNVAAAHYDKYNTLRLMSKLRGPAVIHFVADGKPWSVLMLEYSGGLDAIAPSAMSILKEQVVPHLLWRKAYFKGTGEVPSNNAVLLSCLTHSSIESTTSVIEQSPKKSSKILKSDKLSVEDKKMKNMKTKEEKITKNSDTTEIKKETKLIKKNKLPDKLKNNEKKTSGGVNRRNRNTGRSNRRKIRRAKRAGEKDGL